MHIELNKDFVLVKVSWFLSFIFFVISGFMISEILFKKLFDFQSFLISAAIWFSFESSFKVPFYFRKYIKGYKESKYLLYFSPKITFSLYSIFSIMFLLPLLSQLKFPLLFPSQGLPTYYPLSTVGRAYGVFTYAAALQKIKKTFNKVLFIALSALIYGSYGYRVDLISFLLIGFFIVLTAKKSLSWKTLLSVFLFVSILFSLVALLGFFKASSQYGNLRNEANPFNLLLYRLGVNIGLYNKIVKKSLPFGYEGLRLRVWTAYYHPNLVIGHFIGHKNKGLTASFFAPFVMDGGLAELISLPLLLGFILGLNYRLRKAEHCLASYLILISELVSKFEMGFSLFELALFAASLRISVHCLKTYS